MTTNILVILVFLLTLYQHVLFVQSINQDRTCSSTGETNIKGFGFNSNQAFQFDGDSGYYNFTNNQNVNVIVGIEYTQVDLPVTCAVYITNKEANFTVYLDLCSFAPLSSEWLTGYTYKNLFNCDYRLPSRLLFSDSVWSQNVFEPVPPFTEGFKCATIAPSPYFFSIAVRTLFSSAENDIMVRVDYFNKTITRMTIYDANTPIESFGMCSISLSSKPANLNMFLSQFPTVVSPASTPSGSVSSTVTSQQADTYCASLLNDETLWNEISGQNQDDIDYILSRCSLDYIRNGNQQNITEIYIRLLRGLVVNEAFINDTFYNQDSFYSDRSFEFVEKICQSYCTMGNDYKCERNFECESHFCDFLVECQNSTKSMIDQNHIKRKPIRVERITFDKTNQFENDEF